ncbi:MAG: hypothetical protein IPN14_08515 [Bacteroidetes bacterium]|nr:hypothetical protein [Bacteroidota bacterium]
MVWNPKAMMMLMSFVFALQDTISKPTSEIDKILKDFDAEIDKLHEAVHSKKYKSGSVVSRADIILALEKAKILYNRIQPVATGNSNPISETVEHYWHFTGNDIVFQSQNRFDDYQIQTGRRWEQLLLSSKESLTYYIFPFKASLEKLIPLFKIILDIKEPPQKASRKKVTTPNNFVGPYFQSDVVNLLYREFVGLGYIIDTKEQKDSFTRYLDGPGIRKKFILKSIG